jgi:hypothetical protein
VLPVTLCNSLMLRHPTNPELNCQVLEWRAQTARFDAINIKYDFLMI